jgi:hypothetical protein
VHNLRTSHGSLGRSRGFVNILLHEFHPAVHDEIRETKACVGDDINATTSILT